MCSDGLSAARRANTFHALSIVPIWSRRRTQKPAQRITLPLGQRAEAIHYTSDPLPVVIGKLILRINAGRATSRRVLARTAG